jgi:tRNA threonylcarbamoyladenosine biosynthesis protein TsaE
MQTVHPPIDLPGDDATAALGRALAARVGPGDTVLLQGGLGAGKTHLARALIQALLPVPEDVPSPSFTLVQTYDGSGYEIWHADLYRLSGRGDIDELGLDQAMTRALCLIEWPDRLADPPPGALWMTLSMDGDGRRAAFASSDPGWTARLRGLDDVPT